MYILNASPVICLFQEIRMPNLLKKLHEISGKILIPEQVLEEIKDRPTRAKLGEFISEGVVEVISDVTQSEIDDLSRDYTKIHSGELSVLRLAQKTGGTAILDDKSARSAANDLGINYCATLGITIKLYKSKSIEEHELKEVAKRMEKSSFRINFKKLGYEWLLE